MRRQTLPLFARRRSFPAFRVNPIPRLLPIIPSNPVFVFAWRGTHMKRFAALRLLGLGAAAILIGSSGCSGFAGLWGNDPPAPPPVRRLVPVTNRYDAPASGASEQNLTYIVESSVVVRDIEPTLPRGEE